MNKKIVKKIKYPQSGTALIMTVLILNVVMLISLSAAQVINSGIKMSGTQARSTKAYFAAESGIEDVLWQWRKNSWDVDSVPPGSLNIFSGALPNGTAYQVNRPDTEEVILRSTGEFSGVKRTVEVQLGF